jgi:hypothetical protein
MTKKNAQRVPDAVQHAVVHRWSGIVTASARSYPQLAKIPGLQRTTPLRHSASKTRVNALMVLRRARESRRAKRRRSSNGYARA